MHGGRFPVRGRGPGLAFGCARADVQPEELRKVSVGQDFLFSSKDM